MPFADHLTAARSSRQDRHRERLRRAAAAARVGPTPAIAVAPAQIGAAFDEAATLNAFKIRVERLGSGRITRRSAPALARAAMLSGRGLDPAVVVVERWWRDGRKAFQVASALGCATRLSLEVLGELRLILRMMRLKKMHAQFGEVVAALCGAPIAAAVE